MVGRLAFNERSILMRHKCRAGRNVPQNSKTDKDGNEKPEIERFNAVCPLVLVKKKFCCGQKSDARDEEDGEGVHVPGGGDVSLEQVVNGAQ